MESGQSNINLDVVEDFGREWQTFNQEEMPESVLQQAFYRYFSVFPFEKLNSESVGFDMGCGSGRWAKFMAPKVGTLNCIDASSLALQQAKTKLENFSNCTFDCVSVSDCQLEASSQDFGYSLGVLHHIPDTMAGIKSCAEKLKSGAPFLIYLYYRFDNKPTWFKVIWKISDIIRKAISSLPFSIKLPVSKLIAFTVYWPLSRISLVLERLGLDVSNIPLSDYRNKPLYCLKTDSLDRFGTKLEHRFTKLEIEKMLVEAGFRDVKFSSTTPFWTAVAIKI